VKTDQPSNGKSRLERIANEPILEWHRLPANAEDGCSLFGMALSDASMCVTRGLAGTEIDEQHRHPAAHDLRSGGTEDDFQIVRVGAEGDNVERLWSELVAHRGTPIQGCSRPRVGDS